MGRLANEISKLHIPDAKTIARTTGMVLAASAASATCILMLDSIMAAVLKLFV